MKIISDNPELLDAIHTKLKLARIEVRKETKRVDGAMPGDVTTLVDVYNFIQEHHREITNYIRAVIELGNYLKSQIQVELKDGTLISFEEYENMSEEDLRKVFLK